MKLLIYSTMDGHMPPWEILPAWAITPKAGMGLALSGGRLTEADTVGGSTFVSMTEHGEAVADGEGIPVVRVTDSVIWYDAESGKYYQSQGGVLTETVVGSAL